MRGWHHRRRGLPGMATLLLATLLLPVTGAAPAGAEEGPVELDPVELDLSRAVELALEHNPALKAVEERRHEVRAGVREARADAWPQLEMVSSWSRSRNPSLLNSPDFEEFIDNFPGGSFEPREQELKALSLDVSQPLFTFGKIRAAVELARQVVEVTEAQIATARLDVALAAAEAFYEVQAARRALETVHEQEEARREFLAVVEARFEIGEATRLELLQAQATLAELRPDLASARGRLDRSRARLRQVLGSPPPGSLALPDGAPEEADFPASPPVTTLVRDALERRPELADLRLQAEALEEQQEVTRADGRPQIELTGSYGRETRLLDDLPDPLFNDWFVAVGMSWELFDGGRRKGQIAQLESRKHQLEWQRRDLAQQVRFELEEAVSAYETARARLLATRVAARASREASRVARESYREGVALLADWLDAQQRETVAEIRLVEARYGARVEAARLLRVLGALPTEEVAGVSTEPPRRRDGGPHADEAGAGKEWMTGIEGERTGGES